MKNKNLNRLELKILNSLFVVSSLIFSLKNANFANARLEDMEAPGGIPIDISESVADLLDYLASNILIFIVLPLYVIGLYCSRIRKDIVLAKKFKKVAKWGAFCSITFYFTIIVISIVDIDSVYFFLWILIPSSIIVLGFLLNFISLLAKIFGFGNSNETKPFNIKNWSKRFLNVVLLVIVALAIIMFLLAHLGF